MAAILTPFFTERLSVCSWQAAVNDSSARLGLETALVRILTPRVLLPLPPSLRLEEKAGGISAWVDARDAESDVYLVEQRSNAKLIGLLILAHEPGDGPTPKIHLGYLLAETAWGQGLATELVKGVIGALRDDGPLMLLGGVGKDNVASARVLKKAGLASSADLSTMDTDIYVKMIG